MKFIKFKETIFNVNNIYQFWIDKSSIMLSTSKDTYSLDFANSELAQKAFVKIAEFLSYSGFSATSGPQIMGYRFSSALLDLDRIE